MPAYCIRHVLPDGTIAGYCGDPKCAVTTWKGLARIIVRRPEEAGKWLDAVRENLEQLWELPTRSGPVLRLLPEWKGYSLEQIRTELELVI